MTKAKQFVCWMDCFVLFCSFDVVEYNFFNVLFGVDQNMSKHF